MYDKQTVYAAAGTSTYVFADAVLQQIISMASSLSEGVMVLTDSTKASGTDYYNSLEFTLWNAVKLTITDTGTAGSTVNLTVKVTVNETEINAGYVPVALSTGGSIRKCIVRMGISTNHDAVVLRLTKQSSDYICLDTIIAKNGNVCMVSTDSTTGTPTATSINAMNKAFYNSATGLSQYSAFDRLGQGYPTVGQFEIMENKAFIENDTFRIQVDGLFDSTTIAPDVLIMMDNKEYYSLDDHTIMEVTANGNSN